MQDSVLNHRDRLRSEAMVSEQGLVSRLSVTQEQAPGHGLHPRSQWLVCNDGLHPRSQWLVCNDGLHPRSQLLVCNDGLHPRSQWLVMMFNLCKNYVN